MYERPTNQPQGEANEHLEGPKEHTGLVLNMNMSLWGSFWRFIGLRDGPDRVLGDHLGVSGGQMGWSQEAKGS